MKVIDISGQNHAPHQDLAVKIEPGDTAPRYPATTLNVKVDQVVVTERATNMGLPIVDLQMTGHDGEKFFTVLTGRQLSMIAAVIAGINLRNHGTIDP